MASDMSLDLLFKAEKLDPYKPGTLYEQLEGILTKTISQGLIKPGEQMPAERQLQEYFAVSQITVRRALAEMVNRGYLRREAGRGTFVMRSVINDSSTMRRGTLLDVLKAEGENVGSQILALGPERPPAEVAAALDICPQREVLRMSRLVIINQDPVYLAHNWIVLPEGQEIAISPADLANASIWDAVARRYGIHPDSAEQTLQAVGAVGEETEVLKVPEGTPMMLAQLLVRDASGRPFGFVKVIHIGSLYRFHTVLNNF